MKPFLRLIFLLLAVIISVPLISLTSLKISGISPKYLKDSFSQKGIYSSVSKELTKVTELPSGLITEKYLKYKVEKIIDDTSSWLAGTGESPIISFDDLSAQSVNQLKNLLTQLKAESEKAKASGTVGPGETDPLTEFIDNGYRYDLGRNIAPLKEYYWWLNQGYWVLVGIEVVSIMAIFLLSSGLKEKFTWIGFLTILLFIWNAIPVAGVFFGQGVLRGLILESPDLPAVAKTVYEIIITPILDAEVKVGIAALAAFLIVSAVSFIASSFFKYPGSPAKSKK